MRFYSFQVIMKSFFFFSSRRRHTRYIGDWSSDVCSSDLAALEPFYFYPYRHVPRAALNDVLIVGAGSGNDVAVALASGARHVDAVEIDPVIQRLGYEHHFNRPYQDPRVSVHISDGRAYLDQTSRRYDLILFALPDSLTLLSGQGNLRLESFLFTTASMRAGKA